MSFRDRYTTSELQTKESTLDLKDLPKDFKLEKDKVVISNDTMALGEMLELLSNRLVR